MSRYSRLSSRRMLALMFVAVLLLAGCAAKRAWWGDTEKGLVLEYRFPTGSPLAYAASNQFKQSMSIMGQTIEVNAGGVTGFSVNRKSMQKGEYTLEITMDSMSVSVDSPQGRLQADTEQVIGKRFDMTLSLWGKELDVSGATEIKYDMGPEGPRSIATEFQALFPDLPGRPITVGDTWTSRDTVTEKNADNELLLTFESSHTLDGFETVAGMECARIKTTYTGTMKGKGRQGPMELVSEAAIKGNDTWFFAYRKGIFVKNSSEGSAEGIITGSGPQEITIPMTRTFMMSTELVTK
ncbi:MAG: hypothetical protein JSV33_00835 [bacterium]|nr:MAG: hypothetical protein JSV33_00835 [bacterium]